MLEFIKKRTNPFKGHGPLNQMVANTIALTKAGVIRIH
jgi:hypothetical protein